MAAAAAAAAAMEGDNEMENKIRDGVSARALHIREQAESLTMSSFRRLLEKDLGLEELSLNAHKKLIQELVDGILNSSSDEPSSAPQAPQKLDELLKGAILKRRTYIKEEADTITMQSMRRLLEKDLKLEEFTLDTCKEVVKELVDEVLKSKDETPAETSKDQPDEAEASRDQPDEAPKTQGKKRKLQRKTTPAKKSKSEEDEDRSTASEAIEPSDKTTEPSRDESDQSVSPAKQTKKRKNSRIVEEEEEEEESDRSSSPQPKRQPKKKAAKAPEVKPSVSAPIQSKLIDQLKQTIKSAGMNIPPSCYKKVKQLPETEREKGLVKELENILKREGLSRHSSEKDIKAVKKQKEKQKDLEGIDVGNILTGRGRRRQAATDFYNVNKDENSSDKSDVQEGDSD